MKNLKGRLGMRLVFNADDEVVMLSGEDLTGSVV